MLSSPVAKRQFSPQNIIMALEQKIRLNHPHFIGKLPGSLKPRYEWYGLFVRCSAYKVNPRDYGSQVIDSTCSETLKLVKENHHTVIVEYPDGTQLKRHKVKHNVKILD